MPVPKHWKLATASPQEELGELEQYAAPASSSLQYGKFPPHVTYEMQKFIIHVFELFLGTHIKTTGSTNALLNEIKLFKYSLHWI